VHDMLKIMHFAVAFGAALLTAGAADAQSLVASQTTLNFTSVADSPAPLPPQTIQLTSTGANVPFALLGYNSIPWVTPGTGSTPATITIAPPTGSATFGTYQVQLVFVITGSAPSHSGSASVVANFTYTLPPPPVVTSVVNAASFQSGPLSPGEIISIFGNNIGPLFDMTTVTSNHTVDPPLLLFSAGSGGTRVTIGGANAPLLYAATGQVNAIVPKEVAGQSNVAIVLSHYGVNAPTVPLPLTGTTPAIFSASGQGSGPGAILNTNSVLNSSSNPAPRGSIIQIFAEGGGMWTPDVLFDGQIANTGSYPAPIAPVSLTIGGQPAQILYTGQAPDLVAGTLQVNAMIPQNIGSGPQPVVLTVGSNSNSSQQITVAVQ
jgi:uncharacterized protein (TIGR03437 family)